MIAGQRVLTIIAARGGSKGVPRKNIRNVGGKPLIVWSIMAAQRSRFVDRVILSSDDEEIMGLAQAHGCEVPFRRPPALARDDTPGIEPVLHAVTLLPDYDIVVLLQPTSPLRLADDVDACIQQLVTSNAPSCVSVTEMESHPYLAYELLPDGVLQSFVSDRCVSNLRRQDFPSAWRLNGAVYVARVPWLKESRTFVASGAVGYVMPGERSLDVDTLEDLALADAVLSANQVDAKVVG